MAHIISITQTKGGATKTTSSINILGALLEKGKKAILCDMDKDKPDAINWARQGERINFVMELFSLLLNWHPMHMFQNKLLLHYRYN